MTLAELRTAVLREADAAGIADDADVDGLINGELGELYELIVEAFEDWQVSTATLTIDSGESSAQVPDDFFKAVDLESLRDPNRPQELPRASFLERNRLDLEQSWILQGQTIMVRPIVRAPGTYTLYYVPSFVPLEDEEDEFVVPNQWEMFAVLGAAARLKGEQELDTSALTGRQDQIRKRIAAAAKHRVVGNPRQSRDVQAGSRWNRLGGWERW